MSTEFQDQALTCGDCGQKFTWSAGEQAFYQEKGFQQPKRCKECSHARKARQTPDGERKGGKL